MLRGGPKRGPQESPRGHQEASKRPLAASRRPERDLQEPSGPGGGRTNISSPGLPEAQQEAP
eukprot:3094684-Pyramimonas_sp.AAC.1